MTFADAPVQVHLVLVLRLALGVVFLVGVASKLLNPRAFVQAVEDYRVLPARLSRSVGVGLIAIEALLAVTLIAGLMTRVSAVAATALFFSFLLAVTINLRRGREIPCGCFGESDEPISKLTAARLLILLAASGTLWAVTEATHTATVGLQVVANGVAGAGYLFEAASVSVAAILISMWLLAGPQVAGVLELHFRLPGRSEAKSAEEL